MKLSPIIPILSAWAALLTVSCQKEAAPIMTATGEIHVTADLQYLQSPTKTSFQTLDGMSSDGSQMHVDCYSYNTATSYFSADAEYSAGKWLFTGTEGGKTYLDYKYYWPETTGALDFFAYYPADLTHSYVSIGTYAAGAPSFSCVNLPVSSDAQTDDVEEFIYAFKSNQTQPTGDNKHAAVGLTFKRPFAQVYIRLNSAIRSTLHSVTITPIYNNGDFANGSWTATGNTTDFVVNSGKKYPEEINNGGIIGGPFIVMPQAIESGVNLIVSYTATGNANPTTVQAVLGMDHSNSAYQAVSNDAAHNRDWKPSYIYIYDINLNGAANEVIMTVGVTAWSPQGTSDVTVE